MKTTLTTVLILFTFFASEAQSAFDNKTQVTASDGSSYTVKQLESTGQSLRVQNSQNSLASEVAKYPDARNEYARTTEFYSNYFTTELNKSFSKEKLFSFRDTRLKFFAVADRSGTIREVYFYVSKGTAITVDDLRKIELMIKKDKLSFFKYQKSLRGYAVVRGATIDDIPEFNGIAYFAINTIIDFDYAYRAVMKITPPREGGAGSTRPGAGSDKPDTSWIVPSSR